MGNKLQPTSHETNNPTKNGIKDQDGKTLLEGQVTSGLRGRAQTC